LTYKQSDFDYSNKKGRLEIVAILCHELGHWWHSDSLKMMAFSLVKIYAIFFAFKFSLERTDMPKDFGFKDEPKSLFCELIIFFMVIGPLM